MHMRLRILFVYNRTLFKGIIAVKDGSSSDFSAESAYIKVHIIFSSELRTFIVT